MGMTHAVCVRMGRQDEREVYLLAQMWVDCLHENPLLMGWKPEDLDSRAEMYATKRDVLSRLLTARGMGGQRVLVAEREGQPVGFAFMTAGCGLGLPKPYRALMSWMCVSPEARGTGAGLALMRGMLRVLLEEHWWPACTEVHVSNERMHALWERLGVKARFCLLPPPERVGHFVVRVTPVRPRQVRTTCALPEGWRPC